MITSQNQPGLPSFLRVTLKKWDGLGMRLVLLACMIRTVDDHRYDERCVHTCSHQVKRDFGGSKKGTMS